MRQVLPGKFFRVTVCAKSRGNRTSPVTAAVFPRTKQARPHTRRIRQGRRASAVLLAHASSACTQPSQGSSPMTDFRHVCGLRVHSGGTARDSHPVLYSPPGPEGIRRALKSIQLMYFSLFYTAAIKKSTPISKTPTPPRHRQRTRPNAPAIDSAPVQIGRASCRERV